MLKGMLNSLTLCLNHCNKEDFKSALMNTDLKRLHYIQFMISEILLENFLDNIYLEKGFEEKPKKYVEKNPKILL